jgi:hypothetical protein
MSAETRWVLYDITAAGSAGDGDGEEGLGTRGMALATASVSDNFDISASNNRLYLTFDGVSSPYITLTSGTNLDPRFVAKDITEKVHNLGKSDDAFDRAQCEWTNNAIKIYSGTLGTSSSVAVISGTNSAHLELGFGTKSEVGGVAETNTYTGGLTISGTYSGLFDEMYHIVMTKDIAINTPAKGGTNSYTGTITTGGVYNSTAADITYQLIIDTTNGTTMGAGTGNVPTLDWTSTGGTSDSNTGDPVELLYPDYWYKVGTRGLMVKFSDAVFNTCTAPNYAWTILCEKPLYVQGTNAQAAAGTAQYVWGSSRGDDATVAVTSSDTALTQLGTRGLSIKFTGSGNFNVGDEFFVIATPPQPSSYDISNINYGNVTVSTESPVKSVLFEIMSGATQMSTVKFGLQSHGSFTHHDENNDDTKFRFGTIGGGNNAGTGTATGLEWRANVTAADISSDTPPSYLYATKEDLAVVSDADTSESIGNSHYMGMVSDVMYLCIKLGASEVGANSTINYRIFFDYA